MRWCTSLAALLGLLAPLTASAPLKDDDARQAAIEAEMKSLKGTWSAPSFFENGKYKDVSQRLTITTYGKFIVEEKDGVVAIGFVAVDPSQKPAHIDLVYVKGPLKGNTWLGLYELKDNKLKVCFPTTVSGDRPLNFRPANQILRYYSKRAPVAASEKKPTDK